MKNYYETLKIEESARDKDIKQAYRTLAMKWHPDRNSNPYAHRIFIEINEAYEILIDPVKRLEYNRVYSKQRLEPLNDKFYKWQNHARTKGESYSKMDFEKYNKQVLSELKIITKHGSSFGCLGFIIFGGILGIIFIIKFSIEGNGEMVMVGFVNLLFYGLLTLWLYPKITKAYKEDRKDLKK